MPVYLEWLESPTEQQWQDLDKLLQDAPPSHHDGNVITSAKQYVKQLNKEYRVALAEFNGHIVAWAILCPHADGWRIKEVLVRRATRARGVATQLIQRLQQWAQGQSKSLYIRQQHPSLNQLMGLGFVAQGDDWVRHN